MAKICGIAKISCPDYDNGMCKGYCEDRVITADSVFGDIAVAQIRYMAKVLSNQERILKQLYMVKE